MQSTRLMRHAQLTLFGVAMAVTVPLMAQSSTPARADSARQHHRQQMAQSLNLSDAQKAQLKTIHEQYRAKFSAARTAAKPNLDAARAARARGDTATARAELLKARELMQPNKALREQQLNAVRNVLTPEQRAKFDATRAKHKNKQGHGHRGKHLGQLKGRGTAANSPVPGAGA